MPTFTVTSVDPGTRPWKSKDGQHEFVDYTVEADGPQGRGGPLQLTRKPSSPVPSVGEVLEGFEIVHEHGRAKLKKEKGAFTSGGNGGGPRQRDPKETAQIVRQHSEHMAILWMAVLQKQPPAGFTLDSDYLKRVIDWFDADVRDNAGQA